ncbi:hypothetical protein D3C87_1910670 [compost metagenome]
MGEFVGVACGSPVRLRLRDVQQVFYRLDVDDAVAHRLIRRQLHVFWRFVRHAVPERALSLLQAVGGHDRHAAVRVHRTGYRPGRRAARQL